MVTTISPEETKQIMKPYIDKLQKSVATQHHEPANVEKIKDFIHQDTKNILEHLEYYLCRNIYLNHTELMHGVSLTDSSKFNSSIKYLKDYDLIIEFKVSTITKQATVYALTEKGYDYLQTPKNARILPRMFKHTYYRDKVAEFLRREGYNPKIEYKPNNRFKGRNRNRTRPVD